MLVVLLGALSVASSGGAQERKIGSEEFRDKGCAHCHAIGGVGGSKGPALDAVGRRLKVAAIRRQILQGGLTMPAFGEVLSKDEVDALVKYLHRCR